ncbi:uncharacterized protein LOC134243912, partial [Saccostrea cucullata]|uniref:uncharacterized protein LOC134243912 n=1 Tax=Saccostrea cuccullata TaxID=36930 RepID=UPI002ED10FAA
NGCLQNVKKVKRNPRLPIDSVNKGSTISEGSNLHAFLFVLIKYAEELMRKKFNEIVKPENLKEHIEKHRKSFKSFKSLEEVQGKLLFPENGEVSTDNFDVTTLYTLFRRTLENIKPQNGWNVFPGDENITLGDDIERIHIIRNFVVHLPLNKEFEKMKKYKEVLLQVLIN